MRDSDVVAYLGAQMLRVEGIKDSLMMLVNSVDCPQLIGRNMVGVFETLKQLQDQLHRAKMSLAHTNVPPEFPYG
jgi:hypothetical protein